MPRIGSDLAFQLTRTPSGIAHRQQPARRAFAYGNGPQHIERSADRECPRDINRPLPAPVAAMHDETALRLHRPADHHHRIWRDCARQIGLIEHFRHREIAGLADGDPHCPVGIMADDGDDRMVEAWIADRGQREQQFAGEIG